MCKGLKSLTNKAVRGSEDKPSHSRRHRLSLESNRQSLELHLHGGDVLSRFRLHQLLDVVVEAPARDLGDSDLESNRVHQLQMSLLVLDISLRHSSQLINGPANLSFGISAAI